MQAECIFEAFDNQNSRLYQPGVVSDYDPRNEKLNGLTTPSGKYVFQYPGHQGIDPNFKKLGKGAVSTAAQEVAKPVEPVAVKVAKPAKVAKPKDKRKGYRTPEQRQNIKDSLARHRQTKLEKLQAAANEEAPAEA